MLNVIGSKMFVNLTWILSNLGMPQKKLFDLEHADGVEIRGPIKTTPGLWALALPDNTDRMGITLRVYFIICREIAGEVNCWGLPTSEWQPNAQPFTNCVPPVVLYLTDDWMWGVYVCFLNICSCTSEMEFAFTGVPPKNMVLSSNVILGRLPKWNWTQPTVI